MEINFAPQEDVGRLELDIDERIKFLGLQSDTFQVFLESSTENGKTEHDINDLKSRIDESLFQLKISAQNSLVNVEKNHLGALNAARKDISILQQRCDLEVANKEEMEYRLGDLQLKLDQANELCNDTKQSYFDDIDTFKKELEGKETQLQISAEEVKSMKGFQKQTEEQMNYLNEYITTIKTSMEDGSIEYEGIVKEVESLKEKLNQERKSHTNQLSMLQQCLDLAIADRQESESHVEQLLLDLKQNREHHQHTKQVHHEKLLEKDEELTIKNEAMTSLRKIQIQIKEEMDNLKNSHIKNTTSVSNSMNEYVKDAKKIAKEIVFLKKMIQQGKIELGEEMKSHIEEINKLEQHLKSITVEKDDSESRLSLLQLELNQTNNKYDDEKYVQNNKIESLTESLKEKNNELRISVEELSSIKEEMRNGNDKAVIISNRMEDCIEDKKKFGQKIVSLEEALGRAEIELKKEKKYHATEVEDINKAIRNKEAAHNILLRELETVNKLKGKMNESKATSKRSNEENEKLVVLMTALSNRFEKLQQYHKEKIFAFKKAMNNKDDEKKQIIIEVSSFKEMNRQLEGKLEKTKQRNDVISSSYEQEKKTFSKKLGLMKTKMRKYDGKFNKSNISNNGKKFYFEKILNEKNYSKMSRNIKIKDILMMYSPSKKKSGIFFKRK